MKMAKRVFSAFGKVNSEHILDKSLMLATGYFLRSGYAISSKRLPNRRPFRLCRNSFMEKHADGIMWFLGSAGDFTATKKMVVKHTGPEDARWLRLSISEDIKTW